jgi:uncharacterized repeat protein (TIGR03803 family)
MSATASVRTPGLVSWLAVGVITLLLAPGASAQSNYKSLHTFNGKNGTAPNSTLIFDPAGNLYGTTFIGGHYNFGTIFKLTPNSSGGWNGNTLYSFCWHCNDGGFAPAAGLTLDAAGNLYGTAGLGGAGVGGTVFKLTPNSDGTWAESVLYSFCSLADCVDGDAPEAGVIFDAAGNLYGATVGGGALGGGTVFKLTPQSGGTWAESVLYSFCGLRDTCAAGSDPIGNLVFDAAGNLYGTTADGGLSSLCAGNGCGVVFKLTPQLTGSWTEKVLHTFNGRDGANSPSSLIFDGAGNLYGTTASGGNLSLCSNISYVRLWCVVPVDAQCGRKLDGKCAASILGHGWKGAYWRVDLRPGG